jgi:ArsR family metal-binding transcriptional regulator
VADELEELEGRGSAGWRRRFGDSIVYSILNGIIGLKCEDCVEQRSYSFAVEIVRADRCIEPQEVMKEGFAPIPEM